MGVGLDTGRILDNYLASFYWAVMTLTTVGFGDVSAMNKEQRFVGIFGMITGGLIFAYGVSQIVNIVEGTHYILPCSHWWRYPTRVCVYP